MPNSIQFSDDFNRPDGPLAAPWQVVDWGGLDSSGIVGNQASITSAGDMGAGNDTCAAIAKPMAGWSDYYEVVVEVTNNPAWGRFLSLRESLSDDSACVGIVHYGSFATALHFYRDSTGSTLTHPVEISAAWFAGDSLTLVIDDGVVSFRVNGVEFATHVLAFTPAFIVLPADHIHTTTYDNFIETTDAVTDDAPAPWRPTYTNFDGDKNKHDSATYRNIRERLNHVPSYANLG